MKNDGSERSFSLLGAVFMITGALILLLSIFNYLQDKKLSLTLPFGLIALAAGALIYSRAKKS